VPYSRYNGHRRPSKVVDFGINRQRVCNFLLVNNDLGSVLTLDPFQRYCRFSATTATLPTFLAKCDGVPLGLGRRCCGPDERIFYANYSRNYFRTSSTYTTSQQTENLRQQYRASHYVHIAVKTGMTRCTYEACNNISVDWKQGRNQEFATGIEDKIRVLGTDGSSPAGSRGRGPVGVWGRSNQKTETNANFQIRRGTCTHDGGDIHHAPPPLATPLTGTKSENQPDRVVDIETGIDYYTLLKRI